MNWKKRSSYNWTGSEHHDATKKEQGIMERDLRLIGVFLVAVVLLGCRTVDTVALAEEGNITMMAKSGVCGVVAKEVTIWKILYGTSDLGENDAETVFAGLDKDKPYALQEKVTGLDMVVTLVVGLFSSITRSTLIITSCPSKEKVCYIDEYGYCEEDYECEDCWQEAEDSCQ